MAERKSIGVSVDLHNAIGKTAKKLGIRVTELLELWNETSDIDALKPLVKTVKRQRRSLTNLKKEIEEYGLDDESSEDIAKRLGYSVAQVDAVTGRAVRRIVLYVDKKKRATLNDVMKNCGVTEYTAKTTLARIRGEEGIPKSQSHLYKV